MTPPMPFGLTLSINLIVCEGQFYNRLLLYGELRDYFPFSIICFLFTYFHLRFLEIPPDLMRCCRDLSKLFSYRIIYQLFSVISWRYLRILINESKITKNIYAFFKFKPNWIFEVVFRNNLYYLIEQLKNYLNKAKSESLHFE